MFTGIEEALGKFSWRAGSSGVLLVAGDAPNHAKNASKNVRGLGINDVAKLCHDRGVTPYVIHTNSKYGNLLAKQIRGIAQKARLKGASPVSRISFAVSDHHGFVKEVGR